MWLHLAAHGAPCGRRPIVYKVPVRERVADYKPLINTMALVATLIATVTFAAVFTMPGGYDTSPDNLGVANLVKNAALKAFIVSDTIAMSCSITAVLTLALSVNRGRELQRRICIMSWVLVGLAMRGTLVAFVCATSLENGTNSRGMTTALENETNSSGSRRPRDVEEGLDDNHLEEGTIQDSMATTVENGTNSRDMATALKNETNSRDMATALKNGTNCRDMATALKNETNSSGSRRPRDVEEGLDDHQLDVVIPSHWRVTNEQGTIITTVLHEALRNGHQEVARYLLGLKPEMATFDNLAGESSLFLAAESRCELFMSDILLSKRPYSTKGPDGLNALHASRHCCGTIISVLIKQNSELMRKLDNDGKAPIHHAVEAYYWVLLDQMLKADPSIALFPDAEGYTALLRASSRGCWKICENILWFCPESIEAHNHKGQHALHLATSRIPAPLGYFAKVPPEMWELINVGDDEGNTPLHLAVKENKYAKAMLLTSSASIDLGLLTKKVLQP
ncbi:hypothetical protein RHSIM_Rhsim04G0028500 [Rhododendron simsii]|uniref:PGG domain-containing protein n=1 Tax=Rhododendron simsii TaxID=118357 RepID=A0A834HE40_RHOSS|nr:hypothetical protein RHSIM_Rhsim04G0028500 [Rhododendron simsii]